MAKHRAGHGFERHQQQLRAAKERAEQAAAAALGQLRAAKERAEQAAAAEPPKSIAGGSCVYRENKACLFSPRRAPVARERVRGVWTWVC